MASLSRSYLIAYNATAMALWALMLYKIVHHFVLVFSSRNTNGFVEVAIQAAESLHKDTLNMLYVAQSMAILEVAHSMFGLVRSPLVTTAMQIASRIFIVWGVMYIAPLSRAHWSYALTVTAWSLVEVPRYFFYLANLLADVERLPFWLKWIRYSLFYVLYPAGITGEVVQTWLSIPYVKRHRILSLTMPNSWNLAFDYHLFLYAVLFIYVPGSYIMYTHMIKARNSHLRSAKKNS